MVTSFSELRALQSSPSFGAGFAHAHRRAGAARARALIPHQTRYRPVWDACIHPVQIGRKALKYATRNIVGAGALEYGKDLVIAKIDLNEAFDRTHLDSVDCFGADARGHP